MANRSKSAGIRSVEDAEKIIQSYAYGKDLDQAILYLKKNDPENGVLATIKDFENDRPMLKVLNALYRADEARKNNDTAELQKIAEFLSTYKAYKDKSENHKKDIEAVLKEFPELKAEEVAAIKEITAETEKANHIREKQNIVREKTPSMSDDEIVANSEKIEKIMSKWSNFINEKDNVTVVDYNGETLDDEKAKEIKALHRQWVELDITSMHSDNAAFAAMSDEEKEETLKRDLYDRFWSDIEAMAAATAKAKGANDDEIEKVRSKVRHQEPVAISTLAYDANREELKEDIANKVNEFDKQKKEKSKNWFSRQFEKLNNLSRKITGYTPVEFGKMIFSAFSSRRFAANIAASMGALGLSGFGYASAVTGLMATGPAIAIAATGIAAYGLYSAYSQQRWSIWEKKHAYWKAAKEKGDAKEIARWSGMAGWNNALKAIKSNPEENKVYEHTKKNNKRYGLLSGVLMGVGTAFVPGGNVAGRLFAFGARGVGANLNANFMYNLAKQKYAENPTEQNEINMKRARWGLILGIAGTTLMEAAVAYNVEHPFIGVKHNPADALQNTNGNDLGIAPSVTTNESGIPEAPWSSYAPGHETGAEGASAPEVAPTEVAAPTVDVPSQYDGSLGVSSKEWAAVHKYGEESFQERYLNTYNAQQANPDAFVNTDGSHMTTVEAEYKSQVILEGLAKEGPDHHFRLFDENHHEVFKAKNGDGFVYANGTKVTSDDIAPECWGSEERVAAFRAVYKAVNCGDKADINAEQFNALYKDAAAGTGNAYGVANECGDIAWYHKLIRKIIPIKTEEPAPVIEEKPVDVVVEDKTIVVDTPVKDQPADNGVQVTDTPVKDQQANSGWVVQTTSTLGKNTAAHSRLGLDGASLKHSVDGGTRIIPNSAVNIGREITR